MESGNEPTAEQPTQPPKARASRAIRSVWPVLVLGLGAAALVAGLFVGVATTPKPDVGGQIRQAERLLGDGEYEEALQVLNSEVLPVIGREWVTPAERGRYHLAVARAVHVGQHELGIRDAANDEAIRREYLAAEEAGAELTPDDVQRLCEAYLGLEQEDRALSRVAKLPEDASAQKREILRGLVEHELAKPKPDFDRAIRVLSTITADADLSASDRAWSLARETEIRLGQGFAPEAVARLLQEFMRFEDTVDAASKAELYALLGAGYFEMGEYDSALKQLERGSVLLGNTEPMKARVEVYQAMCEQALGRLGEARDRYAATAAWSDKMDWQIPALFGLAETEGLLGRTEESIEAYAEVVGALLEGRSHALIPPERVAESLLHQAEDRLTAEEPRAALRFVLRAEELFNLEQPPAEVLRTLAYAHQMLANRTINDEGEEGLERRRQIMALDPATRETVQRHFLAAAGYYTRHAAAVMLADNEGYVQSLWLAANAYDRGGDYRQAVASFRQYIDGVPDDPGAAGRTGSRAEARFRMGRAYQALGEHKLAADEFESLLADAELGEGVGQYGDESIVPLAQVYLDDADPENDAEARRLLSDALSGRLGGEESGYFHDALLELGALHHSAGEYLEAIERLREAIERYPDDPELPVLEYRLADSLRQEAAAIERTLATDAMPDARAVELAQVRAAHLREALLLFESVRDGLEARAGVLSASERVAMRNAYFFLGDCAFDLGDYEASVQHYETARERFVDDPASLVAMVQIVNAYVATGQTDRARAANERAKLFYSQLPEDAWDDPYLPMSRADWERWLDSTAELYGFGG